MLGWVGDIERETLEKTTFRTVVFTGDSELKVCSPYSPPEHADGTVHRTKADALAAEHD